VKTFSCDFVLAVVAALNWTREHWSESVWLYNDKVQRYISREW